MKIMFSTSLTCPKGVFFSPAFNPLMTVSKKTKSDCRDLQSRKPENLALTAHRGRGLTIPLTGQRAGSSSSSSASGSKMSAWIHPALERYTVQLIVDYFERAKSSIRTDRGCERVSRVTGWTWKHEKDGKWFKRKRDIDLWFKLQRLRQFFWPESAV